MVVGIQSPFVIPIMVIFPIVATRSVIIVLKLLSPVIPVMMVIVVVRHSWNPPCKAEIIPGDGPSLSSCLQLPGINNASENANVPEKTCLACKYLPVERFCDGLPRFSVCAGR